MYRKETEEERLDNLWMDLQALEMDRHDLLRQIALPEFFRGAASEAAAEVRIARARRQLGRINEERAAALRVFAAAWDEASYDARVSVAGRAGIDPTDMAAHIEALRETFEDEPDWELAILSFTSWLTSQLPPGYPARRPVIEDEENALPTHPEPVRREHRAIQAMIFVVVIIILLAVSGKASFESLRKGWSPSTN